MNVGFAAFIIAALICSTIVPLLFSHQASNDSDPCDGYGNCIDSSIAYTRSNPDQSLYLGDSFTVTPWVSVGPNTASYSLSWSYDGAVLMALGGGIFQLIANVSGTYSVTVRATFTIVETVGNSTVTLHSSLSTTQSVETRAFLMSFQTQLNNVTNSLHQVLRNPDGSFYHEDEFVINYTYSFLFVQQRPDIKVIVEPRFDPSFVQLTAFQNSSSTGYFLFTVANHTGTSEITMQAKALNFQGAPLESKTQKQPFAVVNYAPYFKYFTYMEYNSRSTSAYGRPFVTLVRYDGNNPGYAYRGDANTAPIKVLNDTRERALINSFNFTTVAWGVKANLTAGEISTGLSFWNQSSTHLGTQATNRTYPILTFLHRVVKFYFTSDISKIEEYTARGVEYFNVTGLAISRHFAGGNHRLFNTSYLYEPVYDSGYITVLTYGPSGLDPSTSVNITLVTPNPLNPHLLSSLNRTFGAYSTIVRDFEKDLFSAYSYVTDLKPIASSGGRWVFLLNDTNLAGMNHPQMPYLNVTMRGMSGSYSYSVPVAFSSFITDRTLVPSLPFPTAHGYYLDQARQLIALALNYSFTSPSSPLIAWDYGSGSLPSLVSPITCEPGNLSKAYGFAFGRNSTIYANLDGGGVRLVGVENGQTNFRAMVMLAPQTGGVTSLWVKDPTGKLILSEALTSNTEPPAPPGYFGFFALSFPMSVNGTYQFGVTNSWGVSSVFQAYDNVVHLPPPPNEEYFLVTFFGFLVLGLYFLGKIFKRHNRKSLTN